MNNMKYILVVVMSFCFVSCLDVSSNTLETNEDKSDIYVYIPSDIKAIYVSVPKETDSIQICNLTDDLKECKKDSSKKFSTASKETDSRKIFGISNDEGSKAFGIDRMDKDQKVIASRHVRVGEENSDDKYAPNPEGIELTKDELSMIVAVNQYREQSGRSILKVCKDLMDGARQQSKLMLSHGQNHWLYPPSGARTENIYYWPRDLNTAMTGFKNSSAHNGNMLNQSHTCIGIGAIIPEKGYGSWTQRFK